MKIKKANSNTLANKLSRKAARGRSSSQLSGGWSQEHKANSTKSSINTTLPIINQGNTYDYL